MNCPFCHKPESRVIDSRLQANNNTRRRRECLYCHERFTTYEHIEMSLPLIIKKDGRREHYEQRKILTGITKACEKRPIERQHIDNIISKIEKNLYQQGDKEVPSSYIGNLVIKEIRRLDKIAYIRFASVYRSFEDVSQFLSAIKGPSSSKSARQDP